MQINQTVYVPIRDKKGAETYQQGVVISIRGEVIIVDVKGDKRPYKIEQIKTTK